jgi:hypothetical protein
MNQSHFFNFLFHLIDVPAANKVTAEKFPHFTFYAHHKWRCGKAVD